MLELLLLSPECLFFSLLLGLGFTLMVLEIISALMGGFISNFADSLLPDSIINFDAEVDGPHAIAGFFDWLMIGRVPFLIWLVVFCLSWAFLGLFAQALSHNGFGTFLNPWLVALGSYPMSLVTTRTVCLVLAKVLPKDETTALTAAEFIGRKVIITVAPENPELPRQASFIDVHGQSHVVNIRPKEGQILQLQNEVYLSEQHPDSFYEVMTTEEFDHIVQNNN